MKKEVYFWHCHHVPLIEREYYATEDRRLYIKRNKDLFERELRLFLFRTAQVRTKAQKEAVEAYTNRGTITNVLKEMHQKQCRVDCPWTRQKGIFTKFSAAKDRWVTRGGR